MVREDGATPVSTTAIKNIEGHTKHLSIADAATKEDQQAPKMEELLAKLPEQQSLLQSDGGMEFAGSAEF